jgi:hypothetical protein
MHDRRAFAGNAVCMTRGVILAELGVFLTGWTSVGKCCAHPWSSVRYTSAVCMTGKTFVRNAVCMTGGVLWQDLMNA